MWVGPSQARLLDLIKEFDLHTVPQFETGLNIAEFGGKRLTASGETIGFDPNTQEEYDRIIRDLTRLSDQVPLEAPWSMAHAEEYDQMTADDWFMSQTKNSGVLSFLRAFVRGIFTADPYQISFLYLLFYLRSGDNYDTLYGFENAAQAWTVKETMHQVAVRVGAGLRNASALKGPGPGISRPQARRVEPLISFLGPEAAHPIDYEDQDWPADPWSRGCYGPSMAPGIMTTVGKVIREPHGRIHWAGTETSTKWTGYIDGAIRSGDRAAAEVLARLKTEKQSPQADQRSRG